MALVEGHAGTVRAINFASNGELVSGGFDGALRLWGTPSSGPVVRALPTACHADDQAVSVQDELDASHAADDANTNSQLTEHAHPQDLQHDGGLAHSVVCCGCADRRQGKWSVYCLGVSDSQDCVISGGSDGTLFLWNFSSSTAEAITGTSATSVGSTQQEQQDLEGEGLANHMYVNYQLYVILACDPCLRSSTHHALCIVSEQLI